MASPVPASFKARFEAFELDASTGELRKSGILLKLQPQPFRVLLLLVERAGQLVTREEIQRCLWTDSTFVDFEHGINFSIGQIRGALADSAENPRYVETLPRRGYRFIGAVTTTNSGPPVAQSEAQETASDKAKITTWPPPRKNRRGYAIVFAGAAIFAILISLAARSIRSHRAPPSAAPAIKSLAVLPLTNLSGDAEQDFFADGMTDALITDLGQVGALRVISRTSAMHYKGTNKSLQEIAGDLNVDALVEGTVTRSGDRVRITANLLQASPEKHLWAQTYERDLRDVLALQDDVARGIAQEIRVQITPREHALLAGAEPVNPDAYTLYLRGRFYLQTGYPVDWTKSQAYFDQAIAKAPSYAPAYIGSAQFYLRAAMSGQLPPTDELWAKAEASAEHAVELDDALAEAHAAIGDVRLFRDWNWTAAEKEYKKALELNPNSADAHSSYANYLQSVGRSDHAIQEGRWALELDPLRVDLSNALGDELSMARKDDEAIAQFQESLKLDPNRTYPVCAIAVCYKRKGMYKEAMAKKVEWLNLRNLRTLADNVEHEYRAKGYRAAERFDAQHFIAEEVRKLHPDCYDLAGAYVRLGNNREALKWLERAYDVRDEGLLLIRADPGMDSLRSDPRYADLVRRIGFPQ